MFDSTKLVIIGVAVAVVYFLLKFIEMRFAEPENQKPVVIVEPWPEHRKRVKANRDTLEHEWRALLLSRHPNLDIDSFVVHPGRLPTDIRHNSKIFREQLTQWLSKVRSRTYG